MYEQISLSRRNQVTIVGVSVVLTLIVVSLGGVDLQPSRETKAIIRSESKKDSSSGALGTSLAKPPLLNAAELVANGADDKMLLTKKLNYSKQSKKKDIRIILEDVGTPSTSRRGAAGQQGQEEEEEELSDSQRADDLWYHRNMTSRIEIGVALYQRLVPSLRQEGKESRISSSTIITKSSPTPKREKKGGGGDSYLGRRTQQELLRSRFCPGFDLIRRTAVTWTSDIAELLPILEAYADEVEAGNGIIEAGSRHGLSTVVLLNRFPTNMSSMEIAVHRPLHALHRYHRDCVAKYVNAVSLSATTASRRSVPVLRGARPPPPPQVSKPLPPPPNSRIDEGDDIKVGLPFPPQLLFIDTLHNYDQLYRELEDFHVSVSSWIILHDTQSRRLTDEEPSIHRKDVPPSPLPVEGGGPRPRGLAAAVKAFLTNHEDEWVEEFNFVHNNGLLVLRRHSTAAPTESPRTGGGVVGGRGGAAPTVQIRTMAERSQLVVPQMKTLERRTWAKHSSAAALLGSEKLVDVDLDVLHPKDVVNFLVRRADDVENACQEAYNTLFAPSLPGHLCPVMPHMVPGLGPGVEYYRTMVIEADRVPLFSRAGLLSGVVFPAGRQGPAFVLGAHLKHDFDRVIEMTALITVLSVFSRFNRKVTVVLPPSLSSASSPGGSSASSSSLAAEAQVSLIRKEMPSLFQAMKLRRTSVVPESDTVILAAATLKEFEHTETFVSSARIVIYGSSVTSGVSKFRPRGFLPVLILQAAVGVIVYEKQGLKDDESIERMHYASRREGGMPGRRMEDLWRKEPKYQGAKMNLDLPLKMDGSGLLALPGQHVNVNS